MAFLVLSEIGYPIMFWLSVCTICPRSFSLKRPIFSSLNMSDTSACAPDALRLLIGGAEKLQVQNQWAHMRV